MTTKLQQWCQDRHFVFFWWECGVFFWGSGFFGGWRLAVLGICWFVYDS